MTEDDKQISFSNSVFMVIELFQAVAVGLFATWKSWPSVIMVAMGFIIVVNIHNITMRTTARRGQQ